MHRKTGKPGFSMRSGNRPSFAKMTGVVSNSPANLNSFGFTKGASPLDWDPTGKTKAQIEARQREIGTKVDGVWGPNSRAADKKYEASQKAQKEAENKSNNSNENNENNDNSETNNASTDNVNTNNANTNNTEGKKVKSGNLNQFGKKALATVISGVTSGLDAVYGTGKVMPTPEGVKFSTDKKDDDEKDKKTTSQQILNDSYGNITSDVLNK